MASFLGAKEPIKKHNLDTPPLPELLLLLNTHTRLDCPEIKDRGKDKWKLYLMNNNNKMQCKNNTRFNQCGTDGVLVQTE